MKKYFILIIWLLGLQAIYGLDTGQQVFQPYVRSLTVRNPDDFMASPVMRLGSNDRLVINFDLIGDQHQYLRYRIIHCNADWQPSRLMETEYLKGFNEVEIDDYAYSSNTYVHYVNYNITLPDPQLPIIRSGNYLLQVFPEGDPDALLVQARFSVSEEITMIKGVVSSKTDRGFNTEYQQLGLSIDIGATQRFNPYQDLKVVVIQNNRPETSRIITHPIRVDRSNVIYEHNPAMIFEAGNEYRRFETVRTDYPGMNVDSVMYRNGIWNAWIKTDYSRKDKEYNFDSTQHGRFKIDEYNSSDPDLSADYVMVHFSLDPGVRQNGNIYIDGNFTNHRFDDTNLMKYDWKDGLYHASIPLKQGSYNYQYVVRPEGGDYVSPAPIEGNKYETNNEYTVMVFLDEPGSRGDRLLGVTTL